MCKRGGGEKEERKEISLSIFSRDIYSFLKVGLKFERDKLI